jgi:hypothetical protein
MKRLLDFNPLTGEACYFESNGTEIAVHHVQTVDPLLERNKKLANNTDRTKKGMKKDWWHYASIPNILIIKWKNELGVDVFDHNHKKKVFELLNSPEYRYLKTTHAKHAPRR